MSTVLAPWPDGDPSLGELTPVRRRLARAVANLFWLLPAALYAVTAARGVSWMDGAMIVNNVFLLRSGSWVNDHNLFLYIGRLWLMVVRLEPAWAMNLLAGAFGAAAVFAYFRVGLLLTRNLLASAAGAVALMFSHSLWWHSTTVEVYTLNTCLTAVMFWFVVRWAQGGSTGDLFAAALCLGLGVSNHVLMGLYLASFAALLLVPTAQDEILRPRVLAGLVLAVALGAQLWFVKFEDDLSKKLDENDTPWAAQTISAEVDATTFTLWRATGGKFQNSMFPTESSAATRWRWWSNFLGLIPYNYPSIALPVGLFGLVAFARDRLQRTAFAFFAGGFFVQALWSSNYFVWDMYAFALPVWTMFSIPVMIGFDRMFRAGGRARRALAMGLPTLLVGPLLYAAVPVWAQAPGFWRNYFGYFPERNLWDAAEFFANPNKLGYTRGDDVAAAYDRTLPKGAQLWDTDALGYWVFHAYYQKVLGNRPDVNTRLVFSAFQDADKVSDIVEAVKRQLGRGDRVFFASVARPMRAVLLALYADLQDPGEKTPEEISKLSSADLIATFPRYEIRQVPLDGLPDAWIYELVPR